MFGPDGQVAGAGFLIAEQVVVTCAHVVGDPNGSRPEGPVAVDFPLLAGADAGTPVSALVESWRPEDDIAVLRLARAVEGAEPLPFTEDAAPEWGGEIRAFGFPEDAPRGVNATGVLRGRQRADRLQIDLAAHGVPIGRGFSGAAVWDVEREAAVGMLVTRGRYGIDGTAYLIPVDRLTGSGVPLPCPFRGLGRFESDDARYFHGREDEARELAAALDIRPVTVLVGPSGSGKSSLLRAGLLAELRHRDTPSVLRVPQPPDGPEAHPEHADAWVAEAVTAAWHAAVPDTSARQDRLDAVRRACTGPEAERIALRGRLCDELGALGAILLLDQFEEYAAASTQAALRAFQLLSSLTQAPDPAQGGGLRVVLTARPTTLESLTVADTATALARAVMFLAPMNAEALTRAVEEPVGAAPGLRLEAGLSRRLVDDAVDEPGCLPLLQFTLTQLWHRREANTLTHATYDEIGKVGGALAAYADEALDQCLSDSGQPEDAARRLFQQLARPDGQGWFTRRAVPTRQLPPGQAEFARALAGRRLLVWDVPQPAAGGVRNGTVHVVHEALLRGWPRAAGWLRDGADFREWQDRTERDAAEWEAQGRPAGLLPHGVRLAQGVEWLRTRPGDLTAAEHAYLEAGRRRQRRGLRRLWGVTGLVTALALVATGLAVDTYRARQRDLEELRTAGAAELSALSEEVAELSPDSSFRYAAGAWSIKHTPAARQALFGQYVRAQDVASSYSGLWEGTAQYGSATPDGRTLMVVSQPDGGAAPQITAVTGALDDRPRTVRLRGLPGDLSLDNFKGAVSDDGRRYAIGRPSGEVLVWDLTAARPTPRRLSGPVADRGVVYGGSVDFSDDGERLLSLLRFETPRPEDERRRGLVRLWDPGTGRALAVSQRSMVLQGPHQAWLLGRGDRMAVVAAQSIGKAGNLRQYHSLDIYETASGDHVREVFGALRSTSVEIVDRGRGVWVTRGDIDQTTKDQHWYSLVPQANQPRGILKGSLHSADLTRTHQVEEESTTLAQRGQFRRVAITDPRGERRYWRATVPGRQDAFDVAVVGSGPGPRVLLAADGDTLFRVRATPVPTPLSANKYVGNVKDPAFAVSPDGSRTARLYDGVLEILGPGVKVRSRPLPERLRKQKNLSLRLLWVARKGGDALLVWSPYVGNARLYDVATLREGESIEWDCGRAGRPAWGSPDDIVQLPDGDLVLLCRGSSLVRIDPRTRVQSGGPMYLERTPPEPAVFAETGRLVPRPGRRDQVAVVTDDWRERGRVEVWDVRRGTRVARLEGSPLSPGALRVAFDLSGDRLATLGDGGRVTWWRVDDERWDHRTRRLPEAQGLMGVAGDGTLLVQSLDGIALYASGDGAPLGLLSQPTTGVLAGWSLSGDSLRLISHEDDVTVSLSPAEWHGTLCAALRGPNSSAQRAAPRLDVAREAQPCPGR
ncbi:nSTAND1 domain-containing NTPase [Streptomyces neyagawaensis]|uniref:Trypsin-like peptidase domain-containing protein n=1 Tax=Streptomyces neyagawaensis TaxID=42238 RepID=A0ABV3AXA9_9ACTN